MKVAIVNQPFDRVLPPNQNSIGLWSYEVAQRVKGECDITIFAGRDGHESSAVIDGVAYRFVRGAGDARWRRIGDRLERRVARARPFYASPLYHADYCLQVAWAIRREGFDVIHVHNLTNFVPLIRRLNPRARLVLHMNCEWLSQLDRERMDARIAAVDCVLGSSDHITGLVRDRFPHHAWKCHTVYNGVDATAFTGRDGAVTDGVDARRSAVVFVGRISPEKGLHDLVDAFTRLAPGRPDTRLELVGPRGAVPLEFIVGVSEDEGVAALSRFYDDDYFETLVARVPPELRDRVVFRGALPRADVVATVGAAAVLANPSYSESFGMALVEAMASEIPVVATRVGGMREIVVDGVTGLMVERGDLDALADAIAALVDDPARGEAMGRAGRERVLERFAWDVVARAVRVRYDELVGSTR